MTTFSTSNFINCIYIINLYFKINLIHTCPDTQWRCLAVDISLLITCAHLACAAIASGYLTLFVYVNEVNSFDDLLCISCRNMIMMFRNISKRPKKQQAKLANDLESAARLRPRMPCHVACPWPVCSYTDSPEQDTSASQVPSHQCRYSFTAE